MKRALFVAFALSFALKAAVHGQQLNSGKNVNVVGGPATVDTRGVPIMGDPYLQRQNEPSMACSSRNPLNCLAGANDYRRLNFPGVKDGRVTGDAWLGKFWTRDGGNTWRSGLLEGYAEDLTPLGQASPAHAYEAAADPIVRPGTNGLFYYTGIAFNRSAISSNAAGIEGKDGVMFVARFIDDNNTQTLETPFRYLGASAVAYSNSAKFMDKPTLAVDVPRTGSATCTIPASGDVPAQSFPGGHVYVAYAAFMGEEDDVHTKIQFHRSADCGQTFSSAAMLSESHKISQSPTIAIEPQSGRVFVAWREFAADKNADQIVVAVSTDLGKTFAKPVVAGLLRATDGAAASFDQPTLPTPEVGEYRLFRTNSYPTACVAGNGTAYVAWAQRGLGPRGEARIVYSTSATGTSWSTPLPVEATKSDGTPYNGHQFMPALACAGDKVTLIWYDQRGDAIAEVLPPDSAFAPLLLDTRSLSIPTRTLDVRAADAIGGAAFGPSVAVTRYPTGVYMASDGTPATLQLQFSLENLPLFGGGVVPFMGDYIDLAPATVFQPIGAGDGQAGTAAGATFKNKRRGAKATTSDPNGWTFNTSSAGTPPFHAIWTDNRDVVAGIQGDPIDQENPPCTPGTQAGSKNQNIYTSRLTSGLVAGVLGNARPLGDDLRAFSVFVQNITRHPKKVELRIANQPIGGGFASFTQFRVPLDPNLPADPRFPFPLEALVGDFAPQIPPFSSISRTVFVSGSGNSPVRVDVDELITSGSVTTVGQQLFAMINPDPSNPAPLDPSLRDFYNETHDSFVALTSTTDYDLLNPNFLNPNFLNPNFLNPNFLNPNFLNPTFLNPTFLNPNFLNPNFLNPNFLNPNFLNPNFLNPNFLNPNFLNTTMTEITWDVTAEGNTSSSYLLTLLSALNFPPNWQSQLLIYRVYLSPWGSGFDPSTGQYNCGLGQSEQHDLLTDVLNPNFLNPNFLNADFSNPNFLNTALSGASNNTTFSLASGESAKIVLRVAHDGTFQPSFVTAVVVPEAVDTADAAAGDTTPSTSPAPLAFAVAPALPSVIQGDDSYSTTVAVTGGTAPYAWADLTPQQVCRTCVPVITMGIPPGMQLDPQTGTISGTPTDPGTWVFRIGVTDSGAPAQTIAGSFAIIVNELLQITTTAIPSAIPNTSYSTTLLATGGAGQRTWSLAAGSLPAGITLSPAGVLSGTTAVLGSFPFSAQVTDSGFPQQTAIRPFTLVVAQPILAFVQQPTDGGAGAGLSNVAVRVQDATGAVIPGIPVTIDLGNNPTGALLTGARTVSTDEGGTATFAGLILDRDGEGYTLAATAAGATITSVTFNIGSISFETLPDGTPACNGCTITSQFSSRGVVFSFLAFVDPEVNTNVTLVDSTAVDPVGAPNHSIRNPGTVGGGFTGTMFLTFAGNPQTVRFRVRAPTVPQDTFVPFDVAALDQNGRPISIEQISRTGGLYTPSSACCGQYREEVLTITNPGGRISRVSIDASFGHIWVDNLAIVGELPLVDFGTPAGSGDFIDRGFYHPAYPGTTLDRVDLWLTAQTQGTYTVAMTARQNSYSGPVVGVATATATLTPGTSTPVSFVFPGGAVTPGSIVTFAMTQVSPQGLNVFYSMAAPQCGLADPNCVTFNPTIETEGTTAPLDTFRRRAVAVRLFGQPGPLFAVGPVGGQGGTPFGPIACAAGSVATALTGRAGDDIDQTNLWCSPVSGTTLGAPTLAGGIGGDTGAPYDLSCPAGSALTGLHGSAGLATAGVTLIDTLGVRCTNLATGVEFTSSRVGIASDTPPFTLNCPAGTVIKAIQGRQGLLLDSITISCQVPR